jgi:metal-sulfur cluster biosynthetic enzyme/ribosomal protein L22
MKPRMADGAGAAMGATLAAELRTCEPQLRITDADARAALDTVIGLRVIRARARLRFGPGRTAEPIARLLDRAILQAEQAGLSPERLIVTSGSAQAAADIVRVRRKAHGKADWITSPTSRVEVSLRPAGLHATASADLPEPPPVTSSPGRPHEPRGAPVDAAAGTVRDALSDVIDPDLGVNIVDLGFVRSIEVRSRTAVITMTLTSAACPLTGIMEDQIRTELVPLAGIDDFRIAWVWLPAWRPADITDDGRAQLRAIGFTL